jgi:hypothetical protein
MHMDERRHIWRAGEEYAEVARPEPDRDHRGREQPEREILATAHAARASHALGIDGGIVHW